jgi:hypothetical protein
MPAPCRPFSRLSAAPLLLLIAVLAGCKVDSVNPISSFDSARPDTAIYGVWRYKDKDELSYLHIGPEFSLADAASQGNRRTRIVIVDHKRNGLTDEAYVAYTSRVGKQSYLNVVQAEGDKTVGYLFVRYSLLDRNTLQFATIDEEALAAAIRAGRIKGTTRGEGLSAETAITAESAEIERFLGAEGGKLFAAPFVVRRVQAR